MGFFMRYYSGDGEQVIKLLGVTKVMRLIKGRERFKDRSRIYIPHTPTDHMMRILGKKSAEELCLLHGGTAIRIAPERVKRLQRDRIILKFHNLDVPVKQIVDFFDLTEQGIYKIIRQAECANYKV